jgi:sugar phosphate permease
MGIYIGGGLANLAGGYVLDFTGTGEVYNLPLVGERQSWQIVFFLIATPTIPLTALLLSMREPIRKGVGKAMGKDGQMRAITVPMSDFWRYLRRNGKTVFSHNIGFAWLSFAGYGAAAWTPSLFIRVHGYEPAFTGKALGLFAILIGPPGLFFAGWLADRLGQRGYRDAKIRVGLLAAFCSMPLFMAYPLVSNGTLALALVALSNFFAAMPWGVAPAAIQELMPNQMRGRASAVYLFIVNLLGLALGPYLLAVLTDYVFKDEMMVNYSLFTACLVAHILAISFLFFCLRHYTGSLDRLASWSESSSEP